MQLNRKSFYGIIDRIKNEEISIIGNNGRTYKYNIPTDCGGRIYKINTRVRFRIDEKSKKITELSLAVNTEDTGKVIYYSENSGYIVTPRGEVLKFDKKKFPHLQINQKVKFDIICEKNSSFASAVNIKSVLDRKIDEYTNKKVCDFLSTKFKLYKSYSVGEIINALKEIKIHPVDFGYTNHLLFLEQFTDFIRFEYPSNKVMLFDSKKSEAMYHTGMEIIRKIGYKDATKLQQYAFRDENFWNKKKIIIMGSTSSGKTALPIIKFIADHQKKVNKKKKLLFVVNLRALASQTEAGIKGFLSSCGYSVDDFEISVSTSEHVNDDNRIKNGETDIAIIIYEKMFIFLSTIPDILDKYDYIILDEIGLVEDNERGAKVDVIMSYICRNKNINVILLANTYNNWSKYIEKYGFYPIRYYSRPIKLNELFFIGDQNGYFGLYDEQGNLVNIPKNKSIYDIIGICMTEFSFGHKMIIFCFSQRECAKLCEYVYNKLRYKISYIPSESERNDFINAFCKKYNVYRYEFEMVYNTEEKILALYNGIAFHNASLPENIRTGVENELFGSEPVISGGIKIMISTETLAYGLNGYVDTVIMSTMIKHNGTSYIPVPYNIYQNCIGRSGRLGYVRTGNAYTFFPSNIFEISQYNTFDTPQFKKRMDIIKFYGNPISEDKEIKGKFSEIVSTSNRNNFIFYFLSLIEERPYSMEALLQMVLSVPYSVEYRIENIKELIDQSVSFFVNEEMMESYHDNGNGENEVKYCITEKGKKYQAYAISVEDYRKIQKAVLSFKDHFYLADYLMELADIESVFKKSKMFFVTNRETENNFFGSQKNGVANLAKYLFPIMSERQHISPDMLSYMKNIIDNIDNFVNTEQPLYRDVVKIKAVFVAYLWVFGAEFSTINIIQGISDETIMNIKRDIGEKMSYYTDIAGVTALYSGIYDTKKLKILSLSLFYGINIDWEIPEVDDARRANEWHVLSSYLYRYEYIINSKNSRLAEKFCSEFEQLEEWQQNYLNEEGVDIESLRAIY